MKPVKLAIFLWGWVLVMGLMACAGGPQAKTAPAAKQQQLDFNDLGDDWNTPPERAKEDVPLELEEERPTVTA